MTALEDGIGAVLQQFSRVTSDEFEGHDGGVSEVYELRTNIVLEVGRPRGDPHLDRASAMKIKNSICLKESTKHT